MSAREEGQYEGIAPEAFEGGKVLTLAAPMVRQSTVLLD